MIRNPRNKILVKIGLTILLALLITHAEDNYGTKNAPDPEILTLEEEKQLSALFMEEPVNKIDSILKICNKIYGFNGNVLVANGHNIILKESYGYANIRNKEKLNEESVFQLASVSKQFTAMAIMILSERGQLDFSDSVQKFIPDFPYKGISIRNLLNHTSGLPNYMWLVEEHWNPDSTAPSNHDMIRMMVEYDIPRYNSPGRRYKYSNTGYAVLAYIVEVVSEQSFGEFTESTIFDPLGMYQTFVYSSAIDREYPSRLNAYYRRWGRYRQYTPSIHDGIVGDKGIYSTSGDLFLWDQALYSGSLVKASTLEEAFKRGKTNRNRAFDYGFGFRLKEDSHSRIVYHHGRWDGFRTGIERYIDDRSTIIVLDHSNYRSIGQTIKKIRAVMLESERHKNTEWLVRSALDTGVNVTIDKFKIIYNDPEAVDKTKLVEVIDYLKQINKPKKSRMIKELFYSISRKSG